MTDTKDSEELMAYWQQQVEAWRGSGLSQNQFCKNHELSYHRFVYWRRKLAGSVHSRSSVQRSGFAVVSYQPEVDAGLTLSLPNGLVVRGISSGNLSLVRQLLDCL